jgi:hypothetical protein
MENMMEAGSLRNLASSYVSLSQRFVEHEVHLVVTEGLLELAGLGVFVYLDIFNA